MSNSYQRKSQMRLYDGEASDSTELWETRNKLKTLKSKCLTVRKERDALKKDNQLLQQELIELKSNMRLMISGFTPSFFHRPAILGFVVGTKTAWTNIVAKKPAFCDR